jgi:RsiW-degrading membrane proteinase PrsW (M82 family)
VSQQQQQPGPNVGSFIVGVVVGLFVGGTALAFLLFVVFGVIVDRLGKNAVELAFVAEYLVAALIGVSGILALRRTLHVGSGLLIGLAAGLLGGSALCNAIVGGLNNMH